MLSPTPDSLLPCDSLYDLTLRFGSEQESLLQNCQSPFTFHLTDPPTASRRSRTQK